MQKKELQLYELVLLMKFTTLEEIKDYFKMNYYEWGENSNPYRNGGKRTYFAGSYDIIKNYI